MNLLLSNPRYWRLLAVLLLTLSLAGCAATFIAAYDETTDRLLSDLTVSTETTVAKADRGQLSETEREKFYAEAEGTVKTMEMRAGLYAKNEKEIAALAALSQRYRALHDRHAAPRTSLTTGLRATLLDLHQIELAKKRSAAFSSGLKKSTTQ